MKIRPNVSQTTLALLLVALGLALIVIGIFRVFNETGSGREIVSAIGLFGTGALLASERLGNRTMVACTLFCLALPILPT